MAELAPISGLQVGMVAGEASGDLLASLLLMHLHRQWPEIRARGIGGSRMTATGFVARWPSEKLAVFGYLDALKVYRSLLRIRDDLARDLISNPPDIFIGVDAPDFNFGLERQLKLQGIPVVHVVCPSFWAWRPKRVEVLKESVDHVLCLFPFEPALLQAHGVKATFIGHPLAQEIPERPDREGARCGLGFSANDTVVALLPGSRTSEVRYIGPVLLETALLLSAERPHLQFVLPTTHNRFDQIVEMVHSKGLSERVKVLKDDMHRVLAAADVAVVTSGTATLEAALFKCPMVIVYKLNVLSWWLLKRMHLQPWVGLPNILAGETIVPELLQWAAQPVAIAQEVKAWLDNPPRIAKVKARFEQLHESLRCNSGELAVQVMDGMIHANQRPRSIAV